MSVTCRDWPTQSQVFRSIKTEGFGHFRLGAGWTVPDVEADPRSFLVSLIGADSFANFDFSIVTPKPDGTSIVSSNIYGDFHTDGDTWLPAHLQILLVDEAASKGGESMLLDGWSLVQGLRSSNPEAHSALFEHVRAIRYVNDLWLGPTVACRQQNVFINHSPNLTDELGKLLMSEAHRAPCARFLMNRGEFYVSNNHRMLHGRSAFEGRRRLLRFMVWLRKPLPAPPAMRRRAERAQEAIERTLRSQPRYVQSCFGMGTVAPSASALSFPPHRLEKVQRAMNQLVTSQLR